MDKTCCMIGCDNNSDANDIHFFQFPTNPNICQIWAKNCGDPLLISNCDAQSFSTKSICSWHFKWDDFIDPESKRLKPTAVPTFARFKYIKTESDDNSEITCTYIKDELVDEENYYYISNGIPENSSAIPKIETCSDERTIRIAEKYNYDNEKQIKIEQCFGKSGKKRPQKRKKKARTSEQLAARRLKQRIRVAEKRRQETKAQSDIRKYKEAVRVALRRSKETDEERTLRRQKNALRISYKRSLETEEQKEARRLKDRVRAAKRRKQETENETKIRRYNDAVRASLRRRRQKQNCSLKKKKIF